MFLRLRFRNALPVAVLISVLPISSLSGCSGQGGPSPPPSTTPLVATPAISPAGGNFKYPETVTITDSSPNAAIYYTEDGTTPTASSTPYTGPITVGQTLTFSAIAIEGAASSAVVQQVFTINAIEGIITTVAGNGKQGYNGDGIQATIAWMNPFGVAADKQGGFYIADTANHRIRMVNPQGVISTVAGDGTGGYSGDGGPATSAELNEPFSIAVDGNGNLYIADYQDHRIREVTPDGTISTVAGNGTAGYSGDGGPATSAELFYPSGVATDASGDLYIADTGNDRIRKVTPAGVITTVAGNGDPGYSGDGGAATAAELWNPLGVAVDNNGNLYIADNYNQCIRKVTAAGVISTLNVSEPELALADPDGLAFDNRGQLLYVADRFNSRVLVMTSDGEFWAVAGNGHGAFEGDGGDSFAAQLNFPTAVALDNLGNLYIADQLNYRIRKVTF